jgi:hypothetical protein
MRIVNLVQGSEEWHRFRLGKITGTRLGSIWSAREYNKDDIEKLLVKRGFDLKAFQKEFNERRKAEGLKSKSYTKGDIEKLLTDADKDELRIDAEKKLEFYQILADQVAVAPADETGEQYYNMMDRGLGKENEAAELFAAKFGKELMVVGCVESEADPRIINSPDRYIKPAKGRIIREAVEVKCLASAKHLMAFFERRIPEEYWTQKVQYFVTNEKLETLYWVFFDPRIPMLPMFTLVVKREDLGHWPETMLKYQLRTLNEIDALTVRLFEESDNIMLPAKPEKG